MPPNAARRLPRSDGEYQPGNGSSAGRAEEAHPPSPLEGEGGRAERSEERRGEERPDEGCWTERNAAKLKPSFLPAPLIRFGTYAPIHFSLKGRREIAPALAQISQFS